MLSTTAERGDRMRQTENGDRAPRIDAFAVASLAAVCPLIAYLRHNGYPLVNLEAAVCILGLIAVGIIAGGIMTLGRILHAIVAGSLTTLYLDFQTDIFF